jgi:hypothetical protein
MTDTDELDLDEAGKLAYAAVVRRLKNDEVTPLGATALARFAQWHMDLTEERRKREKAARPKPEESAARADDFLADMKRLLAEGRIEADRLAAIWPSYLELCREHLAEAESFGAEISGAVAV